MITRIMDIVGLPHDHAEHMQLLKYGPGEYYRLHHDWIPQQEQALCGPRVYTFFLYLSDVEEGGGTKFDLGFTVQPKKGKAVIWPATHNERPFVQDPKPNPDPNPNPDSNPIPNPNRNPNPP